MSSTLSLVDALIRFDTLMLAYLPAAWMRLIAWSFVLSIAVMGLYAMTSPQRRLDQLRSDSREQTERILKGNLKAGEDVQASLTLLKTALLRFTLTLGPAVLSGLPVLQAWGVLDFRYGTAPALYGHEYVMTVSPADAVVGTQHGEILQTPDGQRSLRWPELSAVNLLDAQGHTIVTLFRETPYSFLNKHAWWNWLVPSPYGYLPEDGPCDTITIAFERKSVWNTGPDWAREWYMLFFAGMVVFSLAIKRIFSLA